MDVELFAVADYASGGERGKLNIMGIFDQINVKSFPTNYHLLVVVLRTVATYPDSETTHPVRVTLEKPNGEKLVEINGQVRVPTMQPGSPSHQNMVMSLNNLPLEESGTYTFRVWIDGQPKGEKAVQVVQR